MQKPESIKNINVLLIGGHPKSGTTLLVSLLDSHPALLVFPEEICIAHVPRERSTEGRAKCMIENSDVALPGKGLIELPNGARDYRHIDGTGYINDLRKRIGSAQSVKACFEAVFKTWAEHDPETDHSQLKYFVEKTPNNERLYSTYRAWFADARFLHIIRDPRDNYTSYLRKRGTWPVEKFADNWAISSRLATERKDLPHYHVLRYEDLVNEPEKQMRAVARFLSIDFDESLLKPTRAGTPWSGNSMFGDNADTIHRTTTGRYRKHLPEGLTTRLEQYLYDEMKMWGYEPVYASSMRRLPLAYRLNEWMHTKVWKIKTGFRVKLDNPAENKKQKQRG